MDYRRKFSAFASRPDAQWVLFGVAFLEAMFVPLPSDFLLIPMALLVPERAFRYAVVAAVGSVAGAVIGYLFGFGVYAVISNYVPQSDVIDTVVAVFRSYSGVFLVAAGFSSVPFNIVIFLSGMAQVNIIVFIAVLFVVRMVRYSLISWLIWRGGTRFQEWLERNFYGTMMVMTLGLLVVSAIGVLLFETA